MFLTRYEYELVDENGKFPKQIAVPDRNDVHLVRGAAGHSGDFAPGTDVSLRYRPRLAPLGRRATSTSEKSRTRRVV
jgi:hypothetical protein